MKLTALQVNNRSKQIAADDPAPVFGWRIEGDERNIRQEAYRIRVTDEKGTPVWDSGNVPSSRMTGVRYEGSTLASDTRYTWQLTSTVRSGGERETVLAAQSTFETGYFHKEDWKGSYLGEDTDRIYHIYGKHFTVRDIARAKLYICCLGHFICYINGQEISDHVLEPGWSVYDKTCFYTAYDVTALIREGENTVLLKLGDGMMNVPGGRYVYYTRSYGKAKFNFQLVLTGTDGGKRFVCSDDTWRRTASSTLFSCIYGGEDYDARLFKKARTALQLTGADWEQAPVVEAPEATPRAMPTESMKVMQRIEPCSVRAVDTNTWLIDLGVNFSGRVRIRVRTDGKAAGEKIVMKPAELLGKDGRVNQWITADSYAWTYTLSDDTEQEYAPEFTYTGFRYVEVTGAVPAFVNMGKDCKVSTDAPGKQEEKAGADAKTEKPAETGAKADNTAEADKEVERTGSRPILVSLIGEFIYPDVETAGDFRCSDPLFNDIHTIILRAILSNTKSYFTDCPTREKLGWLEQTHLIGPSIMYNIDAESLYAKIEQDMADAQHADGLIPDICPEYVTGFEKWHSGFLDSPEWGSACILSPWYAYKRYGDASVLKAHYPVMKRYLSYLTAKTHHEILHHGLGDWLDIGPSTPNSQNTPVPVVASAVYYLDLRVMRQVAQMLGEEADAAAYEDRMKAVYEEYNLQFLDDQTGRYATGSQAAQAMSLMAGLVPAGMEEAVIKQLRSDIERRGYAVTAGDIGHPFLVAALMKYGMTDLLYKMTKVTKTPGYGYQVACGATTLCEDWDGPDPRREHGSQNHLMLGSIEEYFYASLGGMELIGDGLPFDEIRIAVHPADGIDWVKAWTMHPYGRIAVSWKRCADKVEVEVEVPPNVTAHLESPDGSAARRVGSGRHAYSFPA